MPRRKRRKQRKSSTSFLRNIRANAADFFGWPWFDGMFSRWDWARIFKVGLVCAFWGAVLLAISIFALSLGLPDINKAVDMDHRPTIIMRDRNGNEVSRLGDVQGEILKVEDMSPHIVKAVMAIEDRRFYKHWGVDPLGMLRAFYSNLRGNSLQGASTITQQLAKNLFLSPERTLTRKVKEALLALYLEQRYTKNEILGAYLNRAYFGAGAYGVDSASRVYFKTSARKLTLEQAAMLAGLLKAPSYYSPDHDPKLTTKRTRIVLSAMVDAGYLRPGAEKMTLQPLPARSYSAGGNPAMHYYADWIMSQIEGYVGVPTQNLVVDTTMDASIQNFSAGVVKDIINKDGPAKNISQAAAVVMQPNGAVIAMVGGKDYQESQYNRAVVSLRQPGSSFKPVIYLAALEAGYTPDTMVDDSPVRIGKYAPGNYDGKYHGQVRLRDAVALSLNTVAVRTLQDVGVSRAINIAQRLGITEPLEPNLSLALGTTEVHVIELTSAYATIANRGMSVEPYGIRMIRDSKGKVLYERRDVPSTAVLDPNVVAMMTEMMQGVVVYGTGQRAMLDRPVAGKTGTSSDYRDAWFMGFTADYVAGVWVGNDDNTPMKKVTGGGTPAGIWHDIMMAANRGSSIKPLPTMSSGYVPSYSAVDGQQQPQGEAPTAAPSGPTIFDNLLNNILGNGTDNPNSAQRPAPQPAHNAVDDNGNIIPHAPSEGSGDIQWNTN